MGAGAAARAALLRAQADGVLLQKKHSQLSQERSQLVLALEQARQAAGVGTAMLEQVHASLSWRITAPLRKGLDTVRRLAQWARLAGADSSLVRGQAGRALDLAHHALKRGVRVPHLAGDFALRARWYDATHGRFLSGISSSDQLILADRQRW